MSLTQELDQKFHPEYYPPTEGSVWCKYDDSWTKNPSEIGDWFHHHACVCCREEVSWGDDSKDALQVWSKTGWFPARIHKKCLGKCDFVVDRKGLLKNISEYYYPPQTIA